MDSFKAFRVKQDEDGAVQKGFDTLRKEDLPEGEVVVKVAYSSINYKDALATQENSGVIREFPAVLGIDLSGTVVESSVSSFKEGDKVLAFGFQLGVGHSGGYSEYARIPADWLIALPKGLSLKEAMVFGTAGFTAAQSVHALQHAGVTPDSGDIVVTGATGGVGSIAIAILSKLGYSVIAATRQLDEAGDYLRELGASSLIHPDDILLDKPRPLAKRRWAGAVENLGGDFVPAILSQTEANGAVALIGNVTGHRFEGTVLPFILRGVQLLGINSVEVSPRLRNDLWELLSGEWKPEQLAALVHEEVALDEIEATLETVLNGGQRQGRYVVKVN